MGLRPSTGRGVLVGRGQARSLIVVWILLISSCSSANRLPRFPRKSHSNVNHQATLEELRPTSHRAVQSAELGQTTEPKASMPALVLPKLLHDHKDTVKHLETLTGIAQDTNHNVQASPTEPADQTEDPFQAAATLSWTLPVTNSEPAATLNSTSSGLVDSQDEHKHAEGLVLKTRLRPHDVLGKGSGAEQPGMPRLEQGQQHTHININNSDTPKRSGILDIVITHYSPDVTEQMVDYWLEFLQSKKVQALKPYVYIYCQNEEFDMTEETFKPILQLGGEVIHTSNIGRESHAYLEHIVNHFNDLANHTLFAQDIADVELPGRFDMLFENKTGFLPLSIVGHVDCEDPWLPKGIIPQIYSMFAQELCPPVGYTSSFQGQFIVSRQRVRARPYWTYQRLLDVLSAETDHWIHSTHTNDYYKDKSNPMFGHVLERTWSVAFACFESWREGNCWSCLAQKGMVDCGDGDCQCFD